MRIRIRNTGKSFKNFIFRIFHVNFLLRIRIKIKPNEVVDLDPLRFYVLAKQILSVGFGKKRWAPNAVILLFCTVRHDAVWRVAGWYSVRCVRRSRDGQDSALPAAGRQRRPRNIRETEQASWAGPDPNFYFCVSLVKRLILFS